MDSGDFYRLEKVGGFIFHRPSPAAVWPSSKISEYNKVDAKYNRFENGKGKWVRYSNVPDTFQIELQDLIAVPNDLTIPRSTSKKLNATEFSDPKFKASKLSSKNFSSTNFSPVNFTVEMQLTTFGHLGLFFEHLVNWKRLFKSVEKSEKVLNLFAYTGMATLVCAAKDAEVTHLDASKTSVAWAKKNAELSVLMDKKVRWLVEDVRKFVDREVRRNSTYDWIILDPPSFGRGASNESWVIEKDLVPLLKSLSRLKSKNFKGILLSSHSPGYTGVSLNNLLAHTGFNEPFEVFEDMTIGHHSYPLPSGFGAWRSSFKI